MGVYTTKDFKEWAAYIRRKTSRERCFEPRDEGSWNLVAALAESVRESGMERADLDTLVDLATDVMIAEIKCKGLPTQPRRNYRSAVDTCFGNLDCFWSKNPLLHVVCELSWVVERAHEKSLDASQLLSSEIGSAVLWSFPYLGHYGKTY